MEDYCGGRVLPLAASTHPDLAPGRRLLAAEERRLPTGLAPDAVLLVPLPDPRAPQLPRREAEAFRARAFRGHGRADELSSVALGFGAGFSGLCHCPAGGPPAILVSEWVLGPPSSAPVRRFRRASLEAELRRASAGNRGEELAEAASRALGTAGLPGTVAARARSASGRLVRVLAHELGHLRLVQALGDGGKAAVRDGSLARRLLGHGIPPSLYAATDPEEWFAEAYALAAVGGHRPGFVGEALESAASGKPWLP